MVCLSPVPPRPYALLLLSALLQGATASEAPAPPAPLFLAECRLEHPQGLVSWAAECGELVVPENRDDPASRHVGLFVARLPALGREHHPEPLFVIAGGPGLAASTFYASVAPAFARIRRERDIVLVDQRGTGRSAPLRCPIAEAGAQDLGQEETVRLMRACRETLERNHDPSQYTTSVAVRDLDDVRRALGYARIALYGSSYGTRVAQHYARRFADNTHALLLDGVVPPTQVLGPTTPLDAESALLAIFDRCRADSSCGARFGDPRSDYRSLRVRLAHSPVQLTVPDPTSGEARELILNGNLFAGALRLASYSADSAALLPLVLHLANDRNQFGPLATQYMLAASGYEAVLAYGMHNSVVCTEDVPFFATAGIDRGKLGDTFLGTSQLDALQAICDEWPRGPMDEDLHAPLASDVPALILSGGADPVTPAAFGEVAARGFSRVQHVVLPGQGHGQLLQPCVDRIMAGFLDAVADDGVAVDTSCIADLKPAPFFLNLNGPAP